MELKNGLRSYLEYLSDVRGVSRTTEKSYLGDINDFLAFLEERGVRHAMEMKPHHLTAYLSKMRTEGRSNATIARRIAAIRSFCKHLVLQRAIDYDPALQLEAPKADKKTPRTISAANLDKLLEQPDVGQTMGLRDRAMLEMLYATGLRVSELVALNVADVRLDMGFLLCLGAGGRERMVPIGSGGRNWAAKYIQSARPGLVKPESAEEALFLNHLGTRLSRQGFWKILRKYAGQIGMEITPHSIRHSFAWHLLENGADVRAVQEMLGHAGSASVQQYLPAIKPKLMEVYERNHPRARADN
jgi:integrase/recombinase XerD